MTDQPEATTPELVQRRRFVRGGALLAAAGAGAVVASATSATTAAAANNDPVTVGGNLIGSSTTTLTVNDLAKPTLALRNSSGPTLALTALTSFTGELEPGQLVNTLDGPFIGVQDGDGTQFTTILATGSDLASLPLPVAFAPQRLIDTRPGKSRANIINSSAGAFDSAGRLKTGAYMDLAVSPTDSTFTDVAAFLNLTSTGSLANGYLFAYPPGDRPVGSTTSFSKAVTTSSSSFTGLGVVGDAFAVRIYTSFTTHVIVDLTGTVSSEVPGPEAAAAARQKARQTVRRRAARRVVRR